ncbi:hypothetical protein GS597_09140 [Synechococcales cyanobacterium C]|uniref:Uncharacterized protein n=1 Tax=Petrachloros mirabilis ULC683 TaxID=2781853 RepID=A0A8K1ZZP3_9CYAN|nr:hypothetical protein [Petrachloros mirabilis]NCJ06667.1 hypothetical protein [Petrachloros mirabilis ULC683]
MTKTAAEAKDEMVTLIRSGGRSREDWLRLQAAISEYGDQEPLLKELPEAFIASSLGMDFLRADEPATDAKPGKRSRS